MKSWTLRITIAAVVLVLLAIIAVIFLPAPAQAPLPSPNGYDDLVQAAAALPKEDAFSDFRNWTRDELATRVAAASNVFALVKAGLLKECRVAPISSSAESDLDGRMVRLASFKQLAAALAARSRLALEQGRTNEAVEVSLDAIQVAHHLTRGGVMIEALVAIACENIALRSLSGALVSELDAATARAAARRLSELDAKAPLTAEILAGERAFARSHGFVGALMSTADRFDIGPIVPARKSFETKWATQAARRHELILQFARRAYEAEKGHAPATDSALVPDYLPALPVLPPPAK